jgi:enoyl-CoA hydratase
MTQSHHGQSLLVGVADGVLTLTWNDPDRLNGLTGQMVVDATDAIESAGDDVRVVVLRGNGRAFCTGARLDASYQGDEPMLCANALIRAIVSCPVPVVAAVNGPAAGFGCSIALAADIVVAADSAYFLLPFVNIGLLPDGGATALVAASMGRAKASAMALLGERLAAADAADAGLIYQAVADDAFDGEVSRIVGQLASGASQAYRHTKRAIAAATLAGLDAALARETAAQVALFETEDFAEGAAAFMAKRAPQFKGR